LVTLLAAIFLFSTHVFAIQAVLGIDFGTEYIKAALVKPGIPLDIVLTKDSRRKETSAVAFKPPKGGPQVGQFPERFYGSDAIALAARFPGEVYPNLKTLLGLPAENDVVVEYAARHPALKLQPHTTRGTAAFKSSTTPEEDAWLVEELVAMELQSIQKNAESAAGDGSIVRSAVITIPPFYTVEEKRSIQSAAELAGFKVLGLVSDGLAVGLNYATSRQFPNINEGAKPEYHMVFDMGAGSTKAEVMKFQSRSVKDVGKFNKTVQEVQVLGSGWDRTLGGDALNGLIIDDMINQFIESKGAQKISATAEAVRKHGRAIAKLTKEAERIRHVLSANQNTQANFEGLYEDVDFKYKITRTEFETMAEKHAERVGTAIKDALKMANLDIADLDSVILHGGATRTPFVQKELEKIVGSADKLRSNVNSDEAAAFGAGFRAAELSPSFRVKEIRILEGASYPTSLKWTNAKGKSQTQRLWSSISPIGGPPKEMTFTEEKDFTGTFYQQVGEDTKDIVTFTTKNLTATIAALKEKYPSCVESGVHFRVGTKLNSENAEVEIVKAAVECEAEIKEGIIDGVKNLFGFGKKDQEPLQGDAESAETETVEGDASEGADSSATASGDASKSATSSGADAESTGSTEEMKADTKKIELVSIPVEFTLEKAGAPVLSKAEITKANDRLKAFSASDKARVQRDEAQNQLEGYIYRIRDILEDESLLAVSTEAERTKIAKQASEASEWLSDEGDEATKDELKTRLKKLQGLVVPIQKRAEEASSRPGLITKLQESLDQTSEFVDSMRKQIQNYEDWHASSSAASSAASSAEPAKDTATNDFEGLEDQDSTKEKTMDDVLEERGPVPPLYKVEDIDELDTLYKTTAEWLSELVAKQEKLGATDDPVLLVKDLNSKRDKIEKAGRDLAMKGVKNFNAKGKGKDKDKKKDKSKKGGDKSATADKPAYTINVGDEEKVFSQEDLEDMINNMSEDDWDTVRKQAEKEEEKKKVAHDEL
jgi:hypoxia up-regulated 1